MLDVPVAVAVGVHRQYLPVKPRAELPLPLPDQLRLEAPGPVPGRAYRHRAELRVQHLRRVPVAAVRLAASLFLTDVAVCLARQRCVDYPLYQARQDPVWADQAGPSVEAHYRLILKALVIEALARRGCRLLALDFFHAQSSVM